MLFSTSPNGPTDMQPGDSLSAVFSAVFGAGCGAGTVFSAVFAAGFAGCGAGRSLASFRRGSRAMVSFTGGGRGVATRWDHPKYRRFTNSSAKKTFRTGEF